MNAPYPDRGIRHWTNRCEYLLLTLAVTALLVLKIFAACRFRFDSDEPQHLHVIWGWIHGFVQYRDVFDNHPPLFHMLMEPLMRLFPERPDIVVPMRFIMIPIYVVSLLALFDTGRSLYSARAGAWLALIAGALPWVFFPGTEFRPDDLYAAFILLALALAAEAPLTRARIGLIGFLLGICAGLTLKTALAVASLAMAVVIALAFRSWLGRWRIAPGETLLRLLICGATALIVPALLCLYFAEHGALPALYYCVFRHNIVPHAERWSGPSLQFFYLPIALPFLLGYAAWIFKQGPSADIAARRIVISLFPLFYLLLLYGYWPDITAQDNLPCIPLLPLALMPLVAAGSRFIPSGAGIAARYLLPPAAFVCCVALILHQHAIQRASVQKYVRPIATVLRLTQPGEQVMDLKGDAIYRSRPFYYALETFTKTRMRLGMIKNEIVPDLISTRTAVCFHPPFPGTDTMAFVNRNYLPLALDPRVLVLGKKLPLPTHGGQSVFETTIAAEYVLVQNGSPASGRLDGIPLSGPVSLEAGEHQFIPNAGNAPVTLFWARAWRLGYRPAD